MTRSVFVTGTDTGIGKTRTCAALLRWGRAQGLRALGLKPLATGAEEDGGELRNDDALTLQRLSTIGVPYDVVNPFCFREPVAPHLAAARVGVRLTVEGLRSVIRKGHGLCDVLVVEGVGGLRVPLNEREDLLDLVRVLDMPVLLVVGLRLGCLNHALLSAEALERIGVRWSWVANRIDPSMLDPDGNLATLRDRLRAPLLWDMPHGFAEEDDAHLVANSSFADWWAC